MKLVQLSEKLLKNMVVSYKEKGKDTFDFEFFKELYPDASDDYLSKALHYLQDDGLVSIFRADDRPYWITLLPNGIANVDENTMLKKGYTILKEIKSLIL